MRVTDFKREAAAYSASDIFFLKLCLASSQRLNPLQPFPSHGHRYFTPRGNAYLRGTAAHTAAWLGTCVSSSRLFSAENKTEPPTLESSWRAQYFFSVVRGCKNPLGKADLLENHLWSVLYQRVWYANWHKHRMNPSHTCIHRASALSSA